MNLPESQRPRSPGEWERIPAGMGGDAPYWSAVIWCPVCLLPFSLVDHAISAAGAVTPSVVCPRDGCSFHDTITLAGWPALPPPVARMIERCDGCGVETRNLSGWSQGGGRLRCPACLLL